MMWLLCCEMEKSSRLQVNSTASMLVGKLENSFVGSIVGKCLTQERDIVTELWEQIAQVFRDVMIE